MAKKAKAENIEVAPQEVVVKAAPTVNPVRKQSWEVKNRTYVLTGGKEPLTFTIPSKHSRRHPLLWFDTKSQTQRELRYATNQSSPFKDEQKGEVTLGHITFRDGVLTVPGQNVQLQKLLSLYHPFLGQRYQEHVPENIAADQVEEIEWEIEALNLAKSIEIDLGEAIVRVEIGSQVNSMSTREIRRDLLLLAKRNPKLFLSLAADENVQLRNFAIKAVENDIVILSPDQRTFTWGSNDRKLMTVPFDENPYSALAAWFKTDEGVEVFRSIEKRLN